MECTLESQFQCNEVCQSQIFSRSVCRSFILHLWSTSDRDLGIIMSHDLSWKNHHDFILSKAYRFLGLLRRTFSTVDCNQAKKILYLSLVRSQLMYCSPIWRPQFLKDIQRFENIQRRATKFITNDYSSSYKSRLVSLHMLPFMMQFELNDILFFVASIKNPTKSFDISEYVIFCSGSTRSSYR